MQLVGGHPALDFVNTLGGLPDAPDDEYLFDYADLLAWTERVALIDSAAAAELRRGRLTAVRRAAVFTAALTLRSHLDAALRAHLRGQQAADHLDALRDAYTAAVAHAALDLDPPRYAWTWPLHRGRPEVPLWIVTDAAIDLLCSPGLERLAHCGHCRWLFLDSSRNHGCRRCSMDSCGARVRMRRYRAGRG
jgi:predicted RNA-binding Zn ribbon-like protein